MKKSIVILVLLLPAFIYSQDVKNKNWIFKLNATQLIDIFSYPTLQVSAERKVNSNFSLNTEIGYQLYDFYTHDTIFIPSRGFKANIEGRVYLPKLINSRIEPNRGEVYMGIQFFYRQNQTTSSMAYTLIADSTKSFSDFFGTKRKAFGVNLIFGYQISIFKNIILEPFAGVGFLNRSIKNSNIEYNEAIHKISGSDLVPFRYALNLEESSGSEFNICTGFRIGYRF